MDNKFWKQKSFSEFTDEEWEALCDGCGKCCYRKIITGFLWSKNSAGFRKPAHTDLFLKGKTFLNGIPLLPAAAKVLQKQESPLKMESTNPMLMETGVIILLSENYFRGNLII